MNRRRPLSPSQFRSLLPVSYGISVLDFVVLRVRASAPVTLSVYNAGREVHEFDSSILMYAPKTSLPKDNPESAGTPGMVIRPGESLRLVMAPPAGTYLYICRRKGHANMTGTLIVE